MEGPALIARVVLQVLRVLRVLHECFCAVMDVQCWRRARLLTVTSLGSSRKSRINDRSAGGQHEQRKLGVGSDIADVTTLEPIADP